MQMAGTREFTSGGGGQQQGHGRLDGSLDFSYGSFLSPRSELLLRQSVSYVNPNNGDSGW